MPDLEIQVEGTPNPNAAKFTLSRRLPVEGSRSYFRPEEAEDDPLAEALFRVEGVRALLIVDDFITVTKTEDADWEELVDPVTDAIRSRFPDAGGSGDEDAG